MKTNKLQWEKFPSVRTGGKSYFLVSIPRGYKIVWNRIIEEWIIMEENGNILGETNSPEKGKKFIENIIKE